MTPRDIEIGARTVYGEARGETFAGRVAVAHVIMTRVLADLHGDLKPDWWGEGIEGVCLKAWQFSCWNANDPNRQLIEKVTLDNPLYLECYGIMAMVAARCVGRWVPVELQDNTEGATHYKVDSLPWPKDWGPLKAPCAAIGRHWFFNDLERGYKPVMVKLPLRGVIA